MPPCIRSSKISRVFIVPARRKRRRLGRSRSRASRSFVILTIFSQGRLKQWQPRITLYLAQRKRGLDGRNARQCPQYVSEERAIVLQISRDDLQQIVCATGNVVARNNTRYGLDFALEPVGQLPVVHAKTHQRKCDQTQFQCGLGQNSPIPFYIPFRFQPLETSSARRFAKSNGFGEARVSRAAISLDRYQDCAIYLVKFHTFHPSSSMEDTNVSAFRQESR